MSLRKLALSACALLVAAAGPARAAAAYPAQPIDLIPAGDPGGGLDLHARMIEMAFTQEKLSDKPFTVVNKGAGGGNAATAYMVTKRGDGYALQINTNRVLLNALKGTTKHTLKDMTPVARLTAEYEIWVVRADSPYKTADDLLAKLKADPGSIAFGIGTAPPATDHLNIVMPCQARGVDIKKLKVVAFRGAGDLATQILGGHIAVGSTSISELIAHIDAGKLRPLVVSAPQRLDRLKGVPTWKETGVDVTLAHWRGIFGPPDMPKEALDYWGKKFEQLSRSKAWKDVLAKNELMDAYLPGDQFQKELERDNGQFRDLLGALGMLGAAP
jgi:putative tricarboxylic transport membrane protein